MNGFILNPSDGTSPGPNRWTLWRTSYDGPTGRVHTRVRVQTAEGPTSFPFSSLPGLGCTYSVVAFAAEDETREVSGSAHSVLSDAIRMRIW